MLKDISKILNKDSNLIALLTIIGFIFYWKTTSYGFVWDDKIHLISNKFLYEISLKNIFIFWSDPITNFMPAAYSGWALIQMIAGKVLNPFNFHLANVILHILNSIFVYLIITKLISNRQNAFWGTLIFLLHPIQVESVAWISEFRGLFSAFGGLSAIYLLLTINFNKMNRSEIFKYLVCVLLFIVSVFSKPSGIVFPFIFIVINSIYMKKKLITTLIIISPWIIFSFLEMFFVFRNYMISHPESVQYVPIYLRFFIWTDAINFYLLKILYPAKFCVNYGRNPISIIKNFGTYFGALLPIILIILSQLFKKHKKVLNTFWLIFIIGFLPVSGLKYFSFQEWSTVADRYLYISMFGFALIISYFINSLKVSYVKIVLGLIFTLVIVKTFFFQIPAWKGDISLWNNAVYTEPSEVRSYYHRGVSYQKKDFHFAALIDFDTVIQMDSLFYDAYMGKVRSYYKFGLFNPARIEIDKITQLYPQHPDINFETGNIFFEEQNYIEAINYYDKALEIDPVNYKTYFSRANAYFFLQDYKSAIFDYTKAIDINPIHLNSFRNRGLSYYKLDDQENANNDTNKFIQMGGKFK
jgi:protein O-mannosyl-transferase